MIWGIPADVFLQFHVAVSLIAIASGLVVLYGLVAAKPLAGWTVLFLATTILTGVTGFPLAPFGLDPARVAGIILLVLMAAAMPLSAPTAPMARLNRPVPAVRSVRTMSVSTPMVAPLIPSRICAARRNG